VAALTWFAGVRRYNVHAHEYLLARSDGRGALGWLLARAAVFPRWRPPPIRVGLVKIANSLALIGVTALVVSG